MLGLLKQKISKKQSKYKNYYSFTILLNKNQDSQAVMQKFKKDLYKIDKEAFAIMFEVENIDKDDFFYTCQHSGILHLHGLIFTNKDNIDIEKIKNNEAISNKLKHKDEYKKKDSTLFIDYIFHKHKIFRIYHNQSKAIRAINLSVFKIEADLKNFNFSKNGAESVKRYAFSVNILDLPVKKQANFAFLFIDTTFMCFKSFILKYTGKAFRKYAIY